MRIAIDVDLTVCAVDEIWWQWLNSIHHTSKKMPDGKKHYDLGVYFESARAPYKGYSSKDFFRREGIYDFAKPIIGAIDALYKAKSKGHEIVFVSHIKGNHHKSKYYWLKRNFSFMDGFVATKEKWLVNADFLIDDRYSNLNAFKGNCTNVLFKTAYSQEEKLDTDVHVMYNWNGFDEILKILESEKTEQ